MQNETLFLLQITSSIAASSKSEDPEPPHDGAMALGEETTGFPSMVTNTCFPIHYLYSVTDTNE